MACRIRSRVVGRFGQQAELDGQRDQLLLGAVVQVPLDPAAFGVLGLGQPAPGREQLVDRGPQLGGQLGVAHDQAGLGGQVPEQAVLGAGQRLAGRLAQGDRAEQVVAVPDRHHPGCGVEDRQFGGAVQLHRGGRGRTARPDRAGPQLGADPDPRLDPAGAGRAGQQRDHPVQGVAQVELAGHVGGEVGQDLVRRGAFAVDQAVGQQAGPLPQRLEHQRDGDRRGDRQQRVARGGPRTCRCRARWPRTPRSPRPTAG